VNLKGNIRQLPICRKYRWYTFLWVCVSLVALAGFGLISYDDDFSDNGDPQVIVLQYLVIVINGLLVSELIKISGEAVIVPLISSFSLLNKAPPQKI
jgi:hypothetical protein